MMKSRFPSLRSNRLGVLTRSSIAVLALCSHTSVHAQVQNTTTKYEYDAVGNVTKIINPLLAVSVQTYDALGRLTSQTDPDNKVTQYSYDGQGRLIQVTDARNLSTLYTLDGLGNQLGLTSPDTGSSSNTVDVAGNILTRTDAKGQITTYVYDILNRVSRITYHDGSITNYSYDQGTNAKGRLTQISDSLGSIQNTYDQRGRILTQVRSLSVNTGTGNTIVTSTTAYQYDSVGRLSNITYPNGRRLTYTRDSMGRVTQIDTRKDGIAITLLSQVSYRPFGGVQSYHNSTGQTYTRGFDLDGRISSYTLNNQVQAISYDAANRIIAINDANNATRNISYGYDTLDRLTSYLTPQANQSFTYDPVGNRNTQTTGAATTTYSYGTTSNRLTQVAGSQTNAIVMDPNGSTTANGVNQFTYDARGRMISANTAIGVVQYQINALGQRVQKSVPAGAGSINTLYHYDQSGKLIAEASGTAEVDYVYLDDIPVAVLK